MKTDPIIKSVVLAAVLWVLPVSEGLAAVPGSDGVYTGCYNKSDKKIRVIDAEIGETCKSDEARITWNKEGPAGPKGDTGEPGDALRADGPCFNGNANRYQDCGNGTVTDTVTGLIWLKEAHCLPTSDWAGANNAAVNLEGGDCGLTDHSTSGDWRLPTREEWQATIARAVELHCLDYTSGSYAEDRSPSLTNTGGTACYWLEPQPLFTGAFGSFWSSTTDAVPSGAAWKVNLRNGELTSDAKTSIRWAWPVRGGQ